MEEKYWDRFITSGSINDYLYYKGMSICSRVMQKYAGRPDAVQETGDETSEPNYSNRDAAYSRSYRRI